MKRRIKSISMEPYFYLVRQQRARRHVKDMLLTVLLYEKEVYKRTANEVCSCRKRNRFSLLPPLILLASLIFKSDSCIK